MSSESPPELDWVHLPPRIEPESLWGCLHDSYLTRIQSELWQRTVTFQFRSYHLQKHFGLPEDWIFQFRFEQVESVRVLTYERPEHPDLAASDASGRELTQEEAYRCAVEANDRSRHVTTSWSCVELALAEEDSSFDVLEAEFVRYGEGPVALRLGGMLHSSDWHQLTIRAGGLTLSRGDRESFTLEELVAMGQAYWKHFSQRRSDP